MSSMPCFQVTPKRRLKFILSNSVAIQFTGPVGTFWPKKAVVCPGNSKVNSHWLPFPNQSKDATTCPPMGDWDGYGAVFSCVAGV